MIQCHNSKQQLGRVDVADLPCKESPYLSVLQQQGHRRDVEVGFGVRDADEDGGGNEAKEGQPRDGGIGEA